MSSVERRSFAKSAQPAELALDEGAALPEGNTPCVTILLCTYNGARFLAAQLASIEQQGHQNWRLIVSDDHSTDATLAIIHHFAQRVPQPVDVRQGPGRGPCANFMALAADPSIEGDYFAFCDQDDIWHHDKLERALASLRNLPQEVCAVYGGRTRLVCSGGEPLGYSHGFSRPPSFANALVQSIAGANTMLFNRAAKRLLEQAGPVEVVSHDWWAYQLVTGNGGIFRYDPEPHLDYRQHSTNRIGSNTGLRAQLKRLRMVLQGGFAAWNEINIAALRQAGHLLTDDALALIQTYEVMRNGTLASRIRAYGSSPLRRQSSLGNVGLLLAAVLKKL